MRKLAILLLGICLVFKGFGQQKNETIDIIVDSKQMILPDLMIIKLDLKYTEKREQDALNRLNTGLDKQILLIEQSGFKQNDIKLSDFRIDENTDWESDKPKFKGYEAVQSIKIIIPVSEKGLIGKLLENLSLNKTENININIETELSDSLNNKIHNDLIKKGISDATEKAKIMTDALNVKLGKVKQVEYGDLMYRPLQKSTIRFIPPVIRDDKDRVMSSSYNILGISETEISDKIHIIWYIE